jgi:hypothetical protein
MSFPINAAGTTWEHNEATFNADLIGAGPWLLRRPVALSLTNSQQGSIVDVDNVRLLDAAGRDLIANGDFSQGGARWLFAADDHLPWHIFSLWVQILFEQGWIGVLALVVAVATSLARLASGMARGDLFAATLLAALVGFLLIGLTESLFDGPRVTTMFFLLLFTALLHPVRRKNASAATDNAGFDRGRAMDGTERAPFAYKSIHAIWTISMPVVQLTGATGFIGSHTCVEVMAAGWTPIVIDNLSNSKRCGAHPDRENHRANAGVRQGGHSGSSGPRRIRRARDRCGRSFAGLKAVGESMADPSLLRQQCGRTMVLLDAMNRHGVKRIVFSSSATVYGITEQMP